MCLERASTCFCLCCITSQGTVGRLRRWRGTCLRAMRRVARGAGRSFCRFLCSMRITRFGSVECLGKRAMRGAHWVVRYRSGVSDLLGFPSRLGCRLTEGVLRYRAIVGAVLMFG